MNVKTTLMLLVMVAALFAAWFFFLRDGPGSSPTHLGQPLFPAFLSAEVQEIHLIDPARRVLESPVTLHRREGETWEVVCDGIDRGRPTRARTAVVQSLLVALANVTPLRVIQDETDVEGELRFGLGERQKITVHARGAGMEPCSLEIGAPVGEGGLVCRTGSSPAIYAIPREILRSLVPAADDLPDPALFQLTPLDVERIIVESTGLPPLEIERSFSRWFVRRPFDGIPGDGVRCDELRQSLLALGSLRRLDEKETEAALSDPPAHRVTLVAAGAGGSTVLLVGQPVKGGVAARLEGDDEAMAITAAILPILCGDRGRYRDRHVIDVPASLIAAVELSHHAHVLRFQRTSGSRFRLLNVDGVETPLRWFDEVEQGIWLDKIRSLEFVSFSSAEDPFEDDVTVKVIAGKVGGEGTRELMVHIGPADEDGLRPVRVAGQPGQGRVTSESVSFLTDPYWNLLERTAWCTDAYFKLGRVRITDQDGKVATFRGHIPTKQADLELITDEKKQAPPPAVLAFQKKLVGGLSVERFLGPEKTPEMEFGAPYLLVEWFEPEGASVDGIPTTDQGTWKKLVIGARRADGLHYGVFEDNLSLVFLVDTADLRPFLTLHAAGK